MCCRSSAPPQALLTLTAAPEAAPDCPRLPRPLWTGTSSGEPSPGLQSGVQKHVRDAFQVKQHYREDEFGAAKNNNNKINNK